MPHRTSLISQPPQYLTISLVDMRQPYTLTTPYYSFHLKLQTSNFTGTRGPRAARHTTSATRHDE
eukprot:scaffold67081_cov75-Phaeocystis_antarctica.AAC.1